MKSPYIWAFAVVLMVLAFAFSVSARDDVKISVVITIMKQDESPVKILGFRLPEESGGSPTDTRSHPTIVLRNTTSKEIRHVGIGNVLGDPSGVSGTEARTGWALGMRHTHEPLSRPLGPEATFEFPEGVLRPYDVGAWAHRLQSNCLHSAVYIISLRFADGTEWSANVHSPGDYQAARARFLQQWTDSIRPQSTKGCDDSLMAREALAHVTGTGWPPPGGDGKAWPPLPAPPRPSPEPLSLLAFTCTVRDTTAWCGY